MVFTMLVVRPSSTSSEAVLGRERPSRSVMSTKAVAPPPTTETAWIAEATTAAHNGALGHAREVLEEYESISAIIANRLIAEFPDANARERLMLDDASVAILLALVPAYRLAELVDAA